MSSAEISYEEWAREFADLSERMGRDGVTCPELQDAMRLSKEAVRKRLRALIGRGEVEPVRLRRTDMTGTERWVIGYRLVAKGKKR